MTGTARPDALRRPSEQRLPTAHPLYAEILRRHDRAIAEGRDTYPDPATGLRVLTARVHLDRGRCCGNGCRHCPFID